MLRKSWLVVLCVIVMASMLLTACGSPKPAAQTTSTPAEPQQSTTQAPVPEPAKPVKLTVATNAVGDWATVLQNISNQFTTDNPNITIDFQAPGKDYENIMKVKMSSNDMPDVFSTHGWAKIRYGNFLADLKDSDWASRISPAIKDSVTDSSGKVYILPLDWEKTGFLYNVDVLNTYGVQVPKTMDEFAAACATIKEKSNGTVAPFHIGSSDTWMMGQVFDVWATSLVVSPAANFQSDLDSHTFNFTNFEKLPATLQDWAKKGYFNKDVLTSKFTDTEKAVAEGKAAFACHGTWMIADILKINPAAKIGLMPVPSMVAGDDPTFAGGEKTTWGAWKDSTNLDASKQFISYYAKPENAAAVCKNTGLASGLTDVQADLGDLTQYYNQYKDIRVFTYFDRVNLPNGIWDPMCKYGQDLFAGAITPKQFDDSMQKDYDRLWAASK